MRDKVSENDPSGWWLWLLLGKWVTGVQNRLRWDFNYLQKVELEEERSEQPSATAQPPCSNPPRLGRELNQVTPTSPVRGRCLWQNCDSNLVFYKQAKHRTFYCEFCSVLGSFTPWKIKHYKGNRFNIFLKKLFYENQHFIWFFCVS